MEKRLLLAALVVVLGAGYLPGTPALGAVVSISPVLLSSDTTITFEGIGTGNRDAVLDLTGASFGERFAGQTLGFSGDFDTLTGTPTNPLTLAAGSPNRNLFLLLNISVTLTGLGDSGSPNFDAIGEGAVSVLFDSDQAEFGFDIQGSNSGTGQLQFFRRDGSVINTLNIGLSDSSFAFRSDLTDIAGVSLTNFNAGGVAFDNFRLTQAEAVPEPSTLTVCSLGVMGLIASVFRRRHRP